jgi:hypothetical protein
LGKLEKHGVEKKAFHSHVKEGKGREREKGGPNIKKTLPFSIPNSLPPSLLLYSPHCSSPPPLFDPKSRIDQAESAMEWMVPKPAASPSSAPLLWDWGGSAAPASGSSGEAPARQGGKEREGKRAKGEEGRGGEVRCQVEGCGLELTGAKEYHRKHRVCEAHTKCPRVVVAGQERRFCQQCSRWVWLSYCFYFPAGAVLTGLTSAEQQARASPALDFRMLPVSLSLITFCKVVSRC